MLLTRFFFRFVDRVIRYRICLRTKDLVYAGIEKELEKRKNFTRTNRTNNLFSVTIRRKWYTSCCWRGNEDDRRARTSSSSWGAAWGGPRGNWRPIRRGNEWTRVESTGARRSISAKSVTARLWHPEDSPGIKIFAARTVCYANRSIFLFLLSSPSRDKKKTLKIDTRDFLPIANTYSLKKRSALKKKKQTAAVQVRFKVGDRVTTSIIRRTCRPVLYLVFPPRRVTFFPPSRQIRALPRLKTSNSRVNDTHTKSIAHRIIISMNPNDRSFVKRNDFKKYWILNNCQCFKYLVKYFSLVFLSFYTCEYVLIFFFF